MIHELGCYRTDSPVSRKNRPQIQLVARALWQGLKAGLTRLRSIREVSQGRPGGLLRGFCVVLSTSRER